MIQRRPSGRSVVTSSKVRFKLGSTSTVPARELALRPSSNTRTLRLDNIYKSRQRHQQFQSQTTQQSNNSPQLEQAVLASNFLIVSLFDINFYTHSKSTIMQFNNLVFIAGVLAVTLQSVIAVPAGSTRSGSVSSGSSSGGTKNVLKKDQILQPYCANVICALYCEYKGRADTSFKLSCDKDGPLLGMCETQCMQTATTGYGQHFGSATERTKLRLARSGLGRNCLKGVRWVSDKLKFESCT